MYDLDHTGFNPHETTLTTANAADLRVHWTANVASKIFAQPIVQYGRIYWGSFDGYEHASRKNGDLVWSRFIGTTSNPPPCAPYEAGVVSSPTGFTITLNGVRTPVLFVGGGDAAMYALDALTGEVIWQTPLGSSPSYFIWDSPVVFGKYVYIGVSSFLDCPLVNGQLFKLDAATGTVVSEFNVMPDGCVGGGIWGSPTVDASERTLYIATGNPSVKACSEPGALAPALVELKTSDLSVVSSWVVPADQQIEDSDFGSTPNLFLAGDVPMVGVPNKNGYYYAFLRDHLDTGPVWSDRVADGTIADLAPAAVGDGALLIGSTHTTINGSACSGGLRSVDPATGAYEWELCLADRPLGSVSMVPGLTLVGAGRQFLVVSTASGDILFQYTDSQVGSRFPGGASVSNGFI
jgi:outer membrane protein assembly factor BamB